MSTDTQLAERCGMQRQNLYRTLNYEGANLENADLGSFIYLAKALECKIDDLVISSSTDNTVRRKKSASKIAGVASCIAAVAASWFVSATWYTLDRSVVDWALVFTSSSALWFVVFGVLSRAVVSPHEPRHTGDVGSVSPARPPRRDLSALSASSAVLSN